MNKPTLESYAEARDVFTRQIAPIEDDVAALYLFGSFVRGEAAPGYSDLDFCLFFENALFEDKACFTEALQTLLGGMRAVQRFGIPLYNFCAYHSAASLERLPPMLASNLAEPGNSTLLLGREVRDEMGSTAVSRTMTRASVFFELRRQLYLPLLPLLQKERLTEAESFMAFGALQYLKYVPEAACATLGLFPGETAAAEMLRQCFPKLDLTPIRTIRQFCITPGAAAAPGELLSQCRTAIRLVEAVNDALLAVQAHG